MKRIKLLLVLVVGIICFTGCGSNKKDIVNELIKKLEKIDGYHITGILEVTNNESIYKYDISVSYEEKDNYKVDLKNQTNDHEQIILKNSSGVYVLTPSLNKSFKFQSEWPYNNSQSYLYQSLISDIKNENTTYKETNDGYVITTNVNYSNNKELKTQKIYIDKKLNIKKVEVLNKDGITKIKMTYKKINNNADFDKNYFELDSNMKVSNIEKEKISSKIDNVIYPLYLPDNTYLESEETIALDDGERIILTFGGDEQFTIIEETISIDDEYTTIPVYGELEFINDSIGNVSDSSVSWSSNGIEYYALSGSLDQNELLQVVNSVNVITVGK